DMLREVAETGAFISINHAWRPNDETCMGCGWLDRDHDTVSRADGIEVVNGGPPVEPGWQMWADWLNRGERLVAVGGSDSHDPSVRQPGQPATVVFATALSEEAIVAGLKSGRVYVRAKADGPSLDFTASGAGATTVMGGTIGAGPIELHARIR